jgi:outer membrane biosynthesis protein TonB
MKPSEMLNQVKTLLGVEVKLEQMKLENGTVLEADKFEGGNEIFIVTEDERVALPIGEYVLEDGQTLVIEEEGIIKEMKSENEEAKEEEVEAEIEVEAEEEEKEEMGYATKEELAEVKSMIEEIKAMLEPKEEMSEEPKEALKEEVKEQVELSEVAQEVVSEVVNEIPEEVKKELSEPAAEPINTNAEVSKTQVKFNIASRRKMSTLDRVMSKINKL